MARWRRIGRRLKHSRWRVENEQKITSEMKVPPLLTLLILFDTISWSGYHRSKFLMKSNSMKYWQTCSKKLLHIKGCWARGSWEGSGARITETERGTHERKSETFVSLLLFSWLDFVLVCFVQRKWIVTIKIIFLFCLTGVWQQRLEIRQW